MNYSQRLHHVIPGGAHTYSRGDDQFPSNAPHLFKRGKGAYLYTANEESFLDYGMGLRAVTLGYAEERVLDAAMRQAMFGNNLTRASLVELEAAEAFVALIPGADMVKFAKNGSNATTAAVKIARAYTKRKYIARCQDHPFLSFDDWFIGDTPVERGIPREHHSLTLHFRYNDIQSVEELFSAYPDQIAGVILEPATVAHPENCFLHKLQETCHKKGALFILDEMITGFRWHLQGAQTYYELEPDLSTFGKGVANGFSVAAVTGKREFMEIGGIKNVGEEKFFFTSTTNGAEMCGMGALLETIDFYKENNVVEHLWHYGEQLIEGMNAIACELGISDFFQVGGVPCSPLYTTRNKAGKACLGMRTLFAQEMVKEKILMPWIALSYAHGKNELERTLDATRKALSVYVDALDAGYERFVIGDVIKPVFRKYI